ncbi:GerAB/ArcD/ProY family transporter [Paenibacillus anseongense]|uniref:GerAB/ArcD/ProY family transporter n=1 Tax=Paenibacillus TaxID=44249 RepID=UPI002DBE7E99|nr:GerAB/ArcD/ProY family transporter [Paenibacillus anseongense]MEC0270976.1 GerAB/ArcD/ProY family transporter [Paenibacillus anseongense]
MQNSVKENYLISGFFTFFLFYASQSGIGGLGSSNILFKDAEQDAWISVLILGLSLHLIVWMIYKMLGNPAKDVVDLHQMIFGRFLGNAISLLLIGYYFIIAMNGIRTYIDIVQVWIFPNISTWKLAAVFIFLIYYLVSGGFRVLTGLTLFSMVISLLLFLLVYYPLALGNLTYLMPVWNHSVSDLLQSSKASFGIFSGFEALLVYFPFIKSVEKQAKWAHLGLLLNTLQFAIVTVAILLYFSLGLLKNTLYPPLVITKIIEFEFVERIEFIFIFCWLIILIPSLCLSIWSCTRIMKRVTHLNPRISLIVLLITFFIATVQFNEKIKVDELFNFAITIGFYFVFAYIPLLFILYVIRSKRKAKLNPV